jgi:alpha-amylase
VFGGLYLPHLRSAVYRELIAAERYLAPAAPEVEQADLDLDGWEDALLETPHWAAWISSRGGRLWGFDDRSGLWNYGDTLARRPEFYHAALRDAALGGGEGQTIHGTLRAKEGGLDALAGQIDPFGRDSFVDRWIEGADLEAWADTRFAFIEGLAGEVVLRAAEETAPAIEKRFRVATDGALEVEYRLESARPRLGKLTVELNLGLHVPQADDRFVEVDGVRATPPHWAGRARHEGVTRSAFVDAWAGRRLDVWTDRRALLERAPIETVSQSEGGVERVFQGIEARFTFAAAVEPGRSWRVCFRLAPTASARTA